LEQGKDAAVEFIKSTGGWEGPWLNDRLTARRPWVHQPQYKTIDRILEDTMPDTFRRRMLPEEMGVRWAQEQLTGGGGGGGGDGGGVGDGCDRGGEGKDGEADKKQRNQHLEFRVSTSKTEIEY
jgi:hypothetical protein